jgi:hypothetical protein
MDDISEEDHESIGQELQIARLSVTQNPIQLPIKYQWS